MVSGGMKYLEADRLLKVAEPAYLMRYYQIAKAVLVVTLMPDVFEDNGIKKGWNRRKPKLLSARDRQITRAMDSA